MINEKGLKIYHDEMNWEEKLDFKSAEKDKLDADAIDYVDI